MATSPTPEHWRASGEYITYKGLRIFVTMHGSGRPVLLLHGFPTASYDFARVVPLLADRYRLIAFDYPGYGFSDKPRGHAYSLFEDADVAQAVAAHAGADRLCALAHDIGDSVVLELLRRGSPAIDSLVMLNGSVLFERSQMQPVQRLLLNPVAGPLMTSLGLVRKSSFARTFNRLFARPLPPAELDAFWSLVSHNDGARNYHRLMRYVTERLAHQQDWLDALAAHTAPLTLVWGHADPVASPQIPRTVMERRPDTTYIPLEDAGHYPHWEAPARVAEAAHTAFG